MKLKFENVGKKYGQKTALSGFTAEIGTGICALLGPNGSGKTTLIKIITDNLRANTGEIKVCGDSGNDENVLKMGIRFREKIGYMPQYPGFYPNFSIEDFMEYVASLKGVKGAAAEKQILEILDRVELLEIKSNKIATLSGGMKQRLAFAQALIGNPAILILDEPTAGLDPRQRIAIRNYISELAFDKIVIIATHIVSDVEFIANQIIMLKKGVIVDDSTPRNLTDKINGKVWLDVCDLEDVTKLQKNYPVTNVKYDDRNGKASVRILSEERPSDHAEMVSPTLEDFYLYTFGSND